MTSNQPATTPATTPASTSAVALPSASAMPTVQPAGRCFTDRADHDERVAFIGIAGLNITSGLLLDYPEAFAVTFGLEPESDDASSLITRLLDVLAELERLDAQVRRLRQ